MFFSSNDLCKAFAANVPNVRSSVREFYGVSYYEPMQPSRRQIQNYTRLVKRAILDRQNVVQGEGGTTYIGKWIRPWEVVPALVEFTAPEGEFGVGVEIEMGFRSRSAARSIAQAVQHWKHITLDYEGGTYPIEATFPPVLYSKYNSRSQASRYLKLLSSNLDAVHRHDEANLIGTHVNVSKGDAVVPQYRQHTLNNFLDGLTGDANLKYFGRRPYGYCYRHGKYVEFKMFNSTTDWKRLRQYVDVAVALADLLYSDRPITSESVSEALEIGYNKRSRKVPA